MFAPGLPCGPVAPTFDFVNDCVFVKVVKSLPFNVLPLIVYVITYWSVPSAAPL